MSNIPEALKRLSIALNNNYSDLGSGSTIPELLANNVDKSVEKIKSNLTIYPVEVENTMDIEF